MKYSEDVPISNTYAVLANLSGCNQKSLVQWEKKIIVAFKYNLPISCRLFTLWLVEKFTC